MSGAAQPHALDPIFRPRSVAVVGVSSRAEANRSSFLGALMEQGFHRRRRLYPVNPKVEHVAGLRCYPSVLDCPGPVDHVISQIPATAVPLLVEQCVQKGVRSIHFFTAGFSETGDADRAGMEARIVARARAGGVRLFGPNCMGLYVPGVGLAFGSGFPRDPGDTFVLSQSGANAMEIVGGLGARGVRFSKVVSFGNGADVAAPELLDYALADAQTRVVIAYLEGAGDGRRLFEALRRCAAVKPTFLLKGGLTEAGARAANSHTGSLAGSSAVFDALCRQSGAVRAHSMAELHDLVVAATTGLRRLRGRGVALVGAGGGHAVLSADQVVLAGLAVPPLPERVQRGLRRDIPVAGTSVRNPVDAMNLMGGWTRDRERQRRVYRLIARAQPVDVLFASYGGLAPALAADGASVANGRAARRAHAERRRDALAELDDYAALQQECGVPVALIRRDGAATREADAELAQQAYRRGLALFGSVERAARAAARLLEWHAQREGLPALR